jgi:arylsulfatase A-like enzyme/predicted Zn-dependent protease
MARTRPTPPGRPPQTASVTSATRRTRSRTLLAVAGAAGLLAGAAWWFGARDGARDGAVVIVMIDTLRADRLPIHGYAPGRAPHLTALARDAVVFDRAYAHAPQTLPSHASLFTGVLPFEHKVRDNLGFTLSPGAVTLASLFRGAGFATAAFVSAYVLRPETGIGQGFETYDAQFPAMAADRSPAQVQRPGPQTMEAAERWLETRTSDRFFLFVHLYEPHKPYRPPERFADLAPYDGEVALADELTGRLIATLKRRGWYDAATLIVLSDHGEGLGDHIEEEHGLFLYDEVIRVPWVMKLPQQQSAGRRVAAPVQHIDLLPTLAARHGLSQAPAGLRGRNLTPLLTGAGTVAPQGIYAEALYPRYHFGWSELLSLTDERYRYIRAPREELYDLERDPGERVNIVQDRAQAAAALRSALDALVAGRNIDDPSAVSAEDRQRLAALGYVGTQTSSKDAARGTLADPKDKAPLLRAYRRAIEAIGEGRLDEGAQQLRRILDEDPAMVDVWSQYGEALSRLGRFAAAFDAYAQMIRLQPDEPNGALGAAAALLALDRLPDARAHAELAIKSAPSEAYQALALIDAAQGRAADAIANAERAARAEPGLPMVAFIRGTLDYNGHRYEPALQQLSEARREFARRSAQPRDLNFMIGDSLARLGRYPEAEPFLRDEVRLYPQHVRARASLAMLYQSMGRDADAARALDDLIRAVPSADAYATAASVWRMFGDTARAAALEAEQRKRFGAGRPVGQ